MAIKVKFKKKLFNFNHLDNFQYSVPMLNSEFAELKSFLLKVLHFLFHVYTLHAFRIDSNEINY